MDKIQLFKNIKKNRFQDREALKVTALDYLKDALVNEEYEQCSELIRLAKEFKASADEVRAVLFDYTRAEAEEEDEATPPVKRF